MLQLGISFVTHALSLCIGLWGTDVTISLFKYSDLIWLLEDVFQGRVYPEGIDTTPVTLNKDSPQNSKWQETWDAAG